MYIDIVLKKMKTTAQKKHQTFSLPIETIEELKKLWRKQSNFVNSAIWEKLIFEKKKKAVENLKKFRSKYWKYSEKEIVETIRENRQSH